MYTTIGKWEPSYLLSDPQGAQVISIPCAPGNGAELIQQFETILDGYLAEGSELPRRLGPPQVAWCSSQFHLSANYFGDVVKHELGITAKEFIRNKIIKKAIVLLVDVGLPVNEVASQLGFNYSNHFTRFFRQATGKSPSDYKKSVQG